MATKHLVLGTTILFCAAAFAQSTPASKSDAPAATSTQSVHTARETGTGMATGKRETQHHPAKVTVPDLKAQAPTGTHHLEQKNIVHRDLAAREASTVENSGDPHEHEIKAPRDIATGQASGKRENKVEPIAIKQEVASPRDSASGMATGKRMHKPVTVTHEVDSEVTAPRDSASGMATGKRQHQPVVIRKEIDAAPAAREAGSGMATGKMSSAQSNPMYKDKGTSGVNPLHESKDDLRVQSGLNATGGAVATGAAAVVKTKTKSNQSNDRVAAGDVNGDGVSDPQKATVNTTRSNIKHQRAAEFTGNGTPDPSTTKITKSRSNIQNNRVSPGPVAADLDGDALPDRKPATTATPAKKADPYGNITWDSTGTAGSDKKAAPKK